MLLRYKVNTKLIQKQYIKMMTKEEKIKLKEMLPPKWVSLIVNGTGLSESYIRKVLSGDRSNLLIEEEALKLAKEYQAKASKIEQLKKSIL